MNSSFWDEHARSWSEAVRARTLESRKVTSPAIVEEILRRQPKSVLDLGCGEGWIASELRPKGIAYLGLDFSPALIDLARSGSADTAFEAVGYDELARGGWRPKAPFELAVFNFSLFEEDLRPLLRQLPSLITASGTILIQTLHPCFGMDGYADGWKTSDFHGMKWYGRTFGSWLRTFSESGLTLTGVVEPLSLSTHLPLSVIFALVPRS